MASNIHVNEQPNILIVDDISTNLVILSEMIKQTGCIPRPVTSVRQAQTAIERKTPQLILLDISMPDTDGFEFCAMLKADIKTRDIPIIFISALDSVEDKIKGFKLGAVDYIAKPFRPRELLSRIRSALRRSGADAARLMLGPLTLDTDKGEVYREGVPLALSALEYRMLLLFAGNRGKLLSRNRLLEELWDMGGEFVNDNTLTVCIKRLRDKIGEDPAAPRIIKTVRGLGYRAD